MITRLTAEFCLPITESTSRAAQLPLELQELDKDIAGMKTYLLLGRQGEQAVAN